MKATWQHHLPIFVVKLILCSRHISSPGKGPHDCTSGAASTCSSSAGCCTKIERLAHLRHPRCSINYCGCTQQLFDILDQVQMLTDPQIVAAAIVGAATLLAAIMAAWMTINARRKSNGEITVVLRPDPEKPRPVFEASSASKAGPAKGPSISSARFMSQEYINSLVVEIEYTQRAGDMIKLTTKKKI